jgi:uncharacterized membrane protein YjfL (UPF0719 family)
VKMEFVRTNLLYYLIYGHVIRALLILVKFIRKLELEHLSDKINDKETAVLTHLFTLRN